VIAETFLPPPFTVFVFEQKKALNSAPTTALLAATNTLKQNLSLFTDKNFNARYRQREIARTEKCPLYLHLRLPIIGEIFLIMAVSFIPCIGSKKRNGRTAMAASTERSSPLKILRDVREIF